MVTSLRGRAGMSRLGCLLTIAILAAIGYFGTNIARAWLRFYEFQDAMEQESRFAARVQDDAIIAVLRAKADSLGLPTEAQQVHTHRKANQIWIWAHYTEQIELPGYIEFLEFAPHAERIF